MCATIIGELNTMECNELLDRLKKGEVLKYCAGVRI
jgi:hypothetical protein